MMTLHIQPYTFLFTFFLCSFCATELFAQKYIETAHYDIKNTEKEVSKDRYALRFSLFNPNVKSWFYFFVLGERNNPQNIEILYSRGTLEEQHFRAAYVNINIVKVWKNNHTFYSLKYDIIFVPEDDFDQSKVIHVINDKAPSFIAPDNAIRINGHRTFEPELICYANGTERTLVEHTTERTFDELDEIKDDFLDVPDRCPLY